MTEVLFKMCSVFAEKMLLFFVGFDVSMEYYAVIGATVHYAVEDLLESSSSSDDSCSEDNDEDEHLECGPLLLLYREVHERQSQYMDVVCHYSELDHWRHFRVSRSTASVFIQFLQPFVTSVYHGGCQPIATEELLYITLMYLGNQGAIRLIADKFGRSESSCWSCIRFVTRILSENQNNFIKWPSASEVPAVSAAFQARSGFPGVVSAVDGCHVKIHPPAKSQKSYLNYKRFHSIILLGFVRADRQFSYISVGFPGSNHDSYVLQRTKWWECVETDTSSLFPSRDFHVIGDSAFPLREFLMVPFKAGGQPMSLQMKAFNRKLSSTRVVVEQAFGDVQNRFRRCLDIQAYIVNAVDTVVASCVVHNVCIANGDMNFPEENDIDPQMCLQVDQTSMCAVDDTTSGIMKRNRLAALLK